MTEVTQPFDDCQQLISGNETKIKLAAEISLKYLKKTPDNLYVNITKNCQEFLSTHNYVTEPLSIAERDFPLAFSILMYKDVQQFERLLRAIYRPQNFYCVHVDLKAADEVRQGVEAVTSCFDNVFTTPDSLDVRWGNISVLEAEIVCMRHLLERKKWR